MPAVLIVEVGQEGRHVGEVNAGSPALIVDLEEVDRCVAFLFVSVLGVEVVVEASEHQLWLTLQVPSNMTNLYRYERVIHAWTATFTRPRVLTGVHLIDAAQDLSVGRQGSHDA